MAQDVTLEHWESRAKELAYEGPRHVDRMELYWCSQVLWSWKQFGSPDVRGPNGSLLHLQKEIKELLKDTRDLEEWADCFILLVDAAWRNGITWGILYDQMQMKLAKNKARAWPVPTPGMPVEHVREYEPADLPIQWGFRWLVGERWENTPPGMSFPKSIVPDELGVALASFTPALDGYPLMFGFTTRAEAVQALRHAQDLVAGRPATEQP